MIVLVVVTSLTVFGLSAEEFSEIVPDGGTYECFGYDGEKELFSVLGKKIYVSQNKIGSTVAEAAVYDSGNAPQKEEIIRLLKAVKLKEEAGDGYLITYCYTPKLAVRWSEGTIFNLQIIETPEKTIISNGIYPGSF